jgi:hypothetical protein
LFRRDRNKSVARQQAWPRARAGATARAIKSKHSKHQDENDQRGEHGTHACDGATSPFGSIDAGLDPRPDDGGFELGGRAEAAGKRKAGTFGTALQRKHFGAEPGW